MEMPEKASAKKMITSYPVLFGALIALLLSGALMVIVIWFPWLGEAWDRHDRLVQAIWFTAAFFAVCIHRLWRWRRRRIFWASMSALFVLHVLGVFFYTTHVQPLLVWQWIILFYIEALITVSFLDWSIRRFGHLDRHRNPR